MSPTPTPYAVWCTGSANPPEYYPCSSGLIYITPQDYERQMADADAKWKCPICGSDAVWDDDNYGDWTEGVIGGRYGNDEE